MKLQYRARSTLVYFCFRNIDRYNAMRPEFNKYICGRNGSLSSFSLSIHCPAFDFDIKCAKPENVGIYKVCRHVGRYGIDVFSVYFSIRFFF